MEPRTKNMDRSLQDVVTMLIKSGSLGEAGKSPHRIVRRLGGGVFEIEHPETGCECMILWSVEHAHWVSYDMGRGRLFCDRCKTEEWLPCPSRRDHLLSRIVWMHPEAVADDLHRFQMKHQECVKAEPQSTEN